MARKFLIIIDTISRLHDVVCATVHLLRRHLNNHIIVLIDGNCSIPNTATIFRTKKEDKFMIHNIINFISGSGFSNAENNINDFLLWNDDCFLRNINMELINKYWNIFISDPNIGHFRLLNVQYNKKMSIKYNDELGIHSLLKSRKCRWYSDLSPCFMRYDFLKDISKFKPANPWQVEQESSKLALKSDKISLVPTISCCEYVNFLKRGCVTKTGLQVAREEHFVFKDFRMYDSHIYKMIQLASKHGDGATLFKTLMLKKLFAKSTSPDVIHKLHKIKMFFDNKNYKKAINAMKDLPPVPNWN